MRKLKPKNRDDAPDEQDELSLFFERMEPKILFSADALSGLAPVDPLDDNNSARTGLDVGQSAEYLTDAYTPTANDTDDQAAAPDTQSLALAALHALMEGQDSDTDDTIGTFLRDTVSPPHERQEVIFVDAATPDYQQLLRAVNTDTPDTDYQIFVLQSERDGIEQINQVIGSMERIDAIHLVSHGNETGFQLGNSWLDQDALSASSDTISGWSSVLHDDADILIYGCNLAAGEPGLQLIDELAGLTGADVAASTDLTGDADLGGDWDLEHRSGQVESQVAFGPGIQTAWKGVLLDTGTAIWADTTTGSPSEVITDDWDGSTFSGTPGSGEVVDHYRIMQGAEAPDRDEKIIVGIQGDKGVSGIIWDGTMWSAIPTTALDGSVGAAAWWGVDVAYEQQSGDAMIVWNDGVNLKHSVWDGTSWTTESAVITAYTGLEPEQMHLVAKPGDDEMILVVNDKDDDDYALVWDGSAWGNAITLDTSGNADNDKTALNVAYEHTSGRAMVVYGTDGDTDVKYRIWDGAAWDATPTNVPIAGDGATGQARWITLDSDPTSNRLIMGVTTVDNDAWASIWDGSTWSDSITASSDLTGQDYPAADVAFESQSGQAMIAYGESATVKFMTWSSGGGWSAEANAAVLGAGANTVLLDSAPRSNDIMLSTQDGDKDVSFARWNGATWGAPDELGTESGEKQYQPFVFLWNHDNIAPTATNLSSTSAYNEGDASVPITDIVVSDSDTGEIITATLTLANTATGSLTSGTFGAATSTYTAGTGIWTVTGSVTDVNAALAAVAFIPTTNNDVDTTITTHIEDAAGAGPADGTITLDVTPTNDAPTATNMSSTSAYNEGDTSVPITDIVVSDVDTGETITATLTLANIATGSLTTGTFGAATSIYIAPAGIWTVTGTVTDVNAALAAVAFIPTANNDVDTTITTHIEDAAGAGPADGTITLDVTPTNDAPTATNMSSTSAYTEDDASVPITDIVVSDVDTGETITATLTLANIATGSLTTGTFGAATSIYIAPAGIWTVTGTVTDVNAALAAVAFIPTANNDVDTTITTHIEDAAGAGPADGIITLDVTPVNDAPTAVAGSDQIVDENALVTLDATGSSDPEGDSMTYAWTQTSGPTVTLSDSAVAQPTFTSPDVSSPTTLTFEVEVDDGQDSTTDTVQITVNPAGLIAFWTFEETGQTVVDVTGHGNDGTLGSNTGSESTDPTRVVDGERGNVLSFDGDDFVDNVGQGPAGNFTVSGWANDDGGGGAWKAIYNSGDGEIWLGVERDSGFVALSIGGIGDWVETAPGTWDTNAWHHVTGTWDGTTAHIYIDGVDMALVNTVGTPADPVVADSMLGSRNGNDHWNGLLDDVRIYDQVLDPLEVGTIAGVPSATNLSSTSAYNEGDASVPITDIVVSDVDTGETITATLTLTDTATGSLSANDGATYDGLTGIWTITGTIAQVNTALANLVFNPTANNDVDTTITTHIEDAAGAGPADGTITLDVTPVNDAPTATNLSSTSAYNEGDASVPITDIVVSDVDTGETITATLTLANTATGSLSANDGATYDGLTGIWTITGTVAQVNTALANLVFNPATNNDVDTSITTHIEDAAGAGPADGTITLDVTPTNDAPTATNMSSTSAYNEGDTSVPITDIVVSDVDTGETITATLTLANIATGSLTTGTFGAATSIYIAPAGIWTVTGTVTDVNAALAAVAFIPTANNDVDTTITTHIEDAAGAGPADGNITLDVTPVNDAPTATNMSSTSAYNEGDASVPITDIVVSDVDTGDTITATLTLANTATGSLSANDGATYDGLTGIWTITGTVAQVNTALANLVFNPNVNNDVDTTITTHIEDAAGAGPMDGTINLNVTASNDAPTATNLSSTSAYNEDDASVAITDIVVSDVDTGETITATLTLANTATGSLSANDGATYDGLTGIWTITGTVAQVNTALASLVFNPAANNEVDTTITTHIEDAAGTGPADGIINLNVTPANDAPTATNLSSTSAYNEGDASVALTDIVVSDVDTGETITATLTLANTATGSLSANDGATYDGLTGIWTITGTIAQVNTALANLVFNPATNNDVDTTITTHIEDAAGAGPADGTITLDVTPANDTPTATNLSSTSAYNEGDASVPITDIVVSDVDTGETITATLTLANTATGSLSANDGATYDGLTGIWTITGTVAQVNTALANLVFNPATNNDIDTTITTHIEDAAGTGPTDGIINLNVTPANDAPTATNLSSTSAYNEGDASVPITDIVVSDVDTGDTITATLTLANTATGSLSANDGATYDGLTGIWTITGTVAQVNTALANLVFNPAANNDVDTTITTHIEDAAGAGPADGTINLNVTAANDAPTATNLSSTSAYNEGDASVPITDIVVSDEDPGDTITATLTLTDTATGSLSANDGASYDGLTGIWTITGTVAQVNTALANLVFNPTTNNDVDTTITTHIEDAAGTGPTDGIINLNVTPANDAPTATNLSSTSAYNEGDASVPITDIVVSDIDTGETITATLTLANTATGSLSANDGASYDGLTGIWAITGTVAQVNTALANLVFNPATNNDVDTSITTHIEDAAGAGPVDGIITLDVTPANDAPTATNLSSTSAYNEGDASVAITDIVVSDVDTGDTITATLTLANTATGSLSANDGATYDGLTGIWTISGTVAQVNTALANLVFNPTVNNDVDTTIASHIEDAAGAGPADGIITLDVTPANDAPTATNLSSTSAYTEDDASVAITDIVVSDVDTGETITATLTLADTATGSLSANDGASYDGLTGIWTITGTVAQVNTALANLVFNPAANNDVDTTITTHVEDAAGAGPADGTINLNVTAANDAPTATNLSSTSAYNEGDASVAFTDIVVSDVDTGDTITATLTLADTATGSLSANDGASYDGLTGIWTITGTVAQVNTALANLVFNPAADNDVDTTITTHIEDAAGAGPVDGIITLDVTPANDAPTATNLSSTSAYNEGDASVALTDIVVSDVDTGDTITATLTLANTATGSLSANDGATYDGLTGIWTITGTVAQVNTALANLVFNPAANNDVDTTITTHIEDAAGAGPADGTINLNVTAANDAPTATNLSSTSAYNEGDASVPITDIVVSDVDTGETITATLTLANTATGSLSANDGASYDGLTGIWTITGTVAQVNTALANLVFNPAADNDVDTTITTHIEDAAGAGPVDGIITLDVTPANDAPTATNLSSTSAYNEGDASVAITDIVVSDVDTGDTITATLTLANTATGSLSANDGATYDGLTGIWTISGTVAQVNTALANLVFNPTVNNDVDTTIASHIEDAAGAGPADGIITLDVTPANDAPTATNLSSTSAYTEDNASVAITDIVVSDVDTGETITATLTLADTATGSLSANDGASYDGLTGIWTITGTVAQVNTALANLVFNPAANNDVDTTITTHVEDAAGAGPADGIITLDVTPVNDAPTAANSTVAADEDVAYVFTASDFSFADIDGDALDQVRVTSLESTGTLQLDGIDVVLNQVISRADIDAGKLTFTSALHEYGTSYDSFGFQVHDGSEYSVASYTMTVDVAAVNDVPVANAGPDELVNEGYIHGLDAGASTDIEGEALEEITPDGGEQQLNTTDTGDQKEVDIAIAPDGSYVAVWEGLDVDQKGVFAQRFDADGTPDGPEVQVNTATGGDQKKPSIAMADDGSYVVAWEGQDADSKGVFAQRFDADGNAVGIEFQVNTDTSGDQKTADVAMTHDGKFVIVWEGVDTDMKGVFGQLYDASGNTVGSEFQVNTTQADDQKEPAVGMASDGSFVVTWEDKNDGNLKGVFAQRFDSNGDFVGQEFRVNTTITGDQKHPDIAVGDDGGFLVSWTSGGAGMKDIFAQRFDADGVAVGAEFQVNTITVGDQNKSRVAMLDDGSAIIAWESPDASDKGVSAQRFDADNNAIGGEFQVNTTTLWDQKHVAVDINDDGEIVIAWEGWAAVDKEVYAQRYDSVNDLSYTWTQISGPPVTISDADSARPTFAVPEGLTGPPPTIEFEVEVSDGENSSTDTVIFTVNRAPTSANNLMTIDEDTIHTFSASDFAFSDVDPGHVFSGIQISTLEAAGSLQLSGVDVTLDQLISNTDIDAGNLRFVPDLNANGVGYGDFGFRVSDGNMLSLTEYTMSIDVTPVQDPPTATNLSSTSAYNEGDASVPITDIVVSDVDTGDIITATLTLADTSTGSLSANDSATYDGLTGIWTITGPVAQVNTALANLVFNPATNNDVDTSITTHIEDAAGAGPADGTITLDVTPTNDAPTATNLSSTAAYNEGDASVVIDDIVVSDVDTGDTITATLTLADTTTGSLSANDGATYDGLTGIWTITGTVAQVNTALANLAFNPATNNDVDTTITTHIEDAAGAGPADGTINLNVTAANDAPTATNLSSTSAYNEGDASVPITDIVVSDVDTGETITATLTLADTATGSLSANDGATYDGLTGIWTITGTVAQVNTALANLVFNPATNNDVDTAITTHIEDAAGAGPADGTVNLNVTAANDAPTATNLSSTAAYNEGDASVAINDIVVSDVDTGDTITATLTLANTATGNLSANDGATYDGLTGIWTITGTVSQVNTALANLVFNPTTNNDVDTTITTHIEDAAGAGPADGTITLDVTPANNAPTATNLSSTSAYNEGDASVPITDIAVSDVDTGETITATLTLADTATGSLSTNDGATYDGLTGIWTITGTVAQVNTALANLVFNPATNNDVDTTITTHIEDAAGAGPADGTINLNVTATNDAPTATNLSSTSAYNEDDTNVPITDIVVSDVDTGDTITATLTLANTATGSLSANDGASYDGLTGIWTITGTVAQVNTALANLVFNPAPDNEVDTTIATHIEDAAGAGPADGIINLNVTAANDAPTATNLSSTSPYNEGDASVAITDIVVSDVDTGDTITATLTLADTSTGSLSANDGATYDGLTGIWTITGTVAQVNAALANLVFNPTVNNDVDTTITTHIEDAAGTGPADGTITLDVTPANDAPTVTNLNSTSAYNEGDASVPITDIVVSDVDTGETITATLTLADTATGSLSTNDGATYDGLTGIWTITGTVAQVNTALANLVFNPATNNDVDTSITTHIEDSAGAGPADGTINLNVTAANDAPTATNLSSTAAYNEDDASVAINDIVVSDVDTGDTITATLTLANTTTGSLSANDGATYDGLTGIWTITGTVAQVNTALANLVFNPTTNNEVDTTITTHIEDAAGLGPADGTITLDVTPANDTPTATNLSSTSAYNEGDASVPITDIVVSDVDTGDTITATLTLVDTTTGSLSANDGATYDGLTGIWTVTGTVAQVNTALANLVFNPATNNDVDTTITTQIEDAAGAGPADGTINLNVTAANDAPTATNLSSTTAYNEGDTSVPITDIVVSDVDTGDTITATLTLADTATGSLSANDGATYDGLTGIWTITGTVAQVNTALANLAFNPATDNDVDTTITTHIEDAAAAGPTDGTITLDVTPANDAPTATNLSSTSAYTEGDANVPITDIVVSDVDTGDTITATLTLANTATGSLSANDGATYDGLTGIWTITGTVAQVNTALANLVFNPAINNDVDTTITTHIEDATGAGPANGIITLDVTPANDAPTATNLSSTTAYNEGDTSVPITDIVVSDVDTGDTITATLTLADTSTGSLSTNDGATYDGLTGIWTITGTVAQVNTALANLVFNPATDNDVDTTITTHIEDAAAAGPTDGTITLDVTPANDAPTATNLSSTSAYTEGDANVPITDIVVSDDDTGETITATLTLADTTTGGLSANDGATYDGLTGIWTITGTVAQVNTALANLVFNPNVNNDVDTTITTHIEDAAGAGPADGTITLDVTPANDAPNANNLSSTSAYNEGDASVPITDIVVSDVDTGDSITATLILADTATGSLSANDGATYDGLTGIWTITGTVAQVNTALANLAFNPTTINDVDTTITTHIEDAAGAGPADGIITLDVTPANDAPTATNLSSTSAYNEGDASVPITDIVVSDVDTGDSITATLTLADTATGNLSANDGATYDGLTGIWTITGTVSQVNTALANLVFNPTTNNEVDTTITTHIEDAAGTGPADGIISLNVTAINDAPTATNLSSTSVYNEGDASIAITDIVVSDVDTGETITATLTLADTATGSLSANDGATYDGLTGIWTITGTVAQVNTALANLVFNPAANNDVDTTITTHIEDAAGAGPADGSITLDVTPANDAPTATNLSSTATYNEGDASVPITDIVVSDVDTGETITATLTLADTAAGNLSANDGATYDSLTGIWTITGTVAQVNTALANLVFNPNVNNDVDTMITTHIEDTAGAGPADGTITLDVTPANDAPTATNLSSTSAYNEGDVIVPITDIVVSDVDTGETITATLTLADTATGSLSANDGATYNGLTGAWSITGTVAQVNTALANLVFNPVTNNEVNTSINVSIEDASGAGPADGAISLNVTPANDAPTATNLSSTSAYNEGDASVPITDIVVSDIDSGDIITATLTLADTSTGSLSANDGASYDGLTGIWSITGTVAQVNTALTNLVFNPTTNNDVDTTITTHIEDAAGAGPADGTITLDVTPANDAPTATNLSSTSAYNEDDTNVPITDIVISDVDTGETITATLTLANTAAGSLSANDGATYDGLTGIWTITGTVAQVNTALANLVFNPTANNDVDTTITTHVEDATGAGPIDGTINLNVTPVNDAPTATNLSSISAYTEGDANVAITDIVVSDVDIGDTITATLTLADTAAGSLGANDGATYDGLTGIWTITGTVAQVNTALANLVFSPTVNNDMDTSISVSIDDGDEDNSGALTGTIMLDVTPVNDAPTATNLSSTSAYNEGDASIAITDIVVSDRDTGDSITATLTLTDTATGSLSANDGATYDGLTGIWTITGTVAQVNTALANLVFNPTADNDLNTSVSVNIDDGDEDGSGALTGNITLNVTPANDAPSATNLSSTSAYDEGEASVALNDIVISDPDGGETVTATLTLANTVAGSLSANDGATYNATTGIWTITGTVSQVNAALANLEFIPAANNLLDTTIAIGIDDGDEDSSGPLIGAMTLTVDPLPQAGPPALPATPVGETLPDEPEIEAAAEETPEDTPAEVVVSETPALADPEADADALMPTPPRAGPSPTLPTAVDDEPQEPRDRNRNNDDGSGEVKTREVEVSKPLGIQVLITKLQEQIEFLDDPLQLVGAKSFVTKLDDMREELVEETEGTEKVIGSSLSVSAGLSVGYVVWLARSGILLSSVLSSMPAWRFIDPLPVLGGLQGRIDDEDEESLESMVQKDTIDDTDFTDITDFTDHLFLKGGTGDD